MDAEVVEGAVDVQGVVMTVATRLGVMGLLIGVFLESIRLFGIDASLSSLQISKANASQT